MNDCSRDLMFPFSGFFVVGGGGVSVSLSLPMNMKKNPKLIKFSFNFDNNYIHV